MAVAVARPEDSSQTREDVAKVCDVEGVDCDGLGGAVIWHLGTAGG